MTGLSTQRQMMELQRLVEAYWSLPEMFRSPHISGAFVERALAEVRDGKALPTYDFIDVLCDDGRTGFQVKATKGATTVTWMRAKIPRKETLIAASQRGSPEKRRESLQALGNAIIDFANDKIQKSFRTYRGVKNIHYARLRLMGDGTADYTEAPLCTRDNPVLFKKEDFTWEWRKEGNLQSQATELVDPQEAADIENSDEARPEVITSLQGTHRNGERWWAWHGRSDNQLHFPGEALWLDRIFEESGLERGNHQLSYSLPTTSLTSREFMERLGLMAESS